MFITSQKHIYKEGNQGLIITSNFYNVNIPKHSCTRGHYYIINVEITAGKMLVSIDIYTWVIVTQLDHVR